MSVLKRGAILLLLANSLGACQGNSSTASAPALPWLEGAVLGAALRPSIASEGSGLRVRLVGPRALQWVSPSPLGPSDVRSLRYELLDGNEQLVAQRTDAMPSGLPPEPPPVLLRHLKPNGQYTLRVLAFGTEGLLISKPTESEVPFAVDQYSGNHNFLNLPLALADRHYPGRLAVHLGNSPNLRYLAVDRAYEGNPGSWLEMYRVFMPAGPSVTVFQGFAPGSSVRVRITPFADEGDSAAPLGPTDFQIVQIATADADASGTTLVFESE